MGALRHSAAFCATFRYLPSGFRFLEVLPKKFNTVTLYTPSFLSPCPGLKASVKVSLTTYSTDIWMDHWRHENFGQKPLNYNLPGHFFHLPSSWHCNSYLPYVHFGICIRVGPPWLLHEHHSGHSFHNLNWSRWFFSKIVSSTPFMELMLKILLCALHWPSFNQEGHSSKQRKTRPKGKQGESLLPILSWSIGLATFFSLLGMSQAPLLT